MTDKEWKERWHEVERFRLMVQETTDPVATALLLDIVLDLEADLNRSSARTATTWGAS
jgi:hypothetical protein